jgi:hypothetical protein
MMRKMVSGYQCGSSNFKSMFLCSSKSRGFIHVFRIKVLSTVNESTRPQMLMLDWYCLLLCV